jgi:hypothetical protein
LSSIPVLSPSNDKVPGGDMEYTVVVEHNRDELVKKVADLIKQGWKPLGGIAVSTIAPIMGIYIFCQALIKEHP